MNIVHCIYGFNMGGAETMPINIMNGQVITISNGIKLEDVEVKESHFLPARSVVQIVNVAKLDHEKKGQDILIRAIALLRDRGINNLCVDFIGEGNSHKFLEKLSENLNVSEQVRFLGLKDRTCIYQHLCDYDFMCHPSRFEGFDFVVAEGMAAKLPVLVATGDGPYEIIGQGKYGFSFENGSVESCANALQYMIQNYHEIVSKVDIAHKHIEKEYSVESMVARYNEAYIE